MNRKAVYKKRNAGSYDAQASDYDLKWAEYIRNTHQKLLKRLNTDPDHRILDLSAGTGYLTSLMLQEGCSFDQFVLNDLSTNMLKKARENLPQHEKIVFTRHSANQLEFNSNSFDHIISLNAFHNYYSQSEVIREVFRLLKPGGHFYLLDWNREGFFKWVNYGIQLLSNEWIQTVTMKEAADLLQSYHLNVRHKESWKHNYWNLFLVSAQKSTQ